jgi:hypothetical protein
MANVEVSIDKIAELLGLDPTTDRETVLATMNRVIADQKAEQTAAQHRGEDERIVAAAIGEGKITSSNRPFWLNALKEDREGTKRVLAILTAVPSIVAAGTAEPAAVVDVEMSRVYEQITGRPLEPTRGPQSVVRAAAQSASPRPTARAAAQSAAARSTFNQPFATTEELDAEIMADPELHRAMWAMGARGGGLEKPPERISQGVQWDPSWNPKHQLVMNDDGTGQWVTPPADYGTPQIRTDSD